MCGIGGGEGSTPPPHSLRAEAYVSPDTTHKGPVTAGATTECSWPNIGLTSFALATPQGAGGPCHSTSPRALSFASHIVEQGGQGRPLLARHY